MTEAQFQFDKVSPLLPDGELKKELKESLEDYSNAKWAWEIYEQAPPPSGHDSFFLAATLYDAKALASGRPNGNKAKELFNKYSPISETGSGMEMFSITTEDFLQAIWESAAKHVKRAKSLSS